MTFWRGVFSDSGEPSFSRVISAVLVGFSCGWVTAIVYNSHHLPDATQLGALGAFMVLFYATNRGTTAFGKQQPPNGQQ